MMATTFASHLDQEFAQLTARLSPHRIAVAYGQDLKLARIKGEFVWQRHRDEDEYFLLCQGRRLIRYRPDLGLGQGEVDGLPRRGEPMMAATEASWVVLVEPASSKHTGDSEHAISASIEPRLAHLRTPNLPTRQ